MALTARLHRRTGHATRAMARAAALAIALALGSLGCRDDRATEPATGPVVAASAVSERGGDGLLVVATTSILGDVVGNVLGVDGVSGVGGAEGVDGRVVVLVPAGVDPHDFQLSAAAGEQLAKADVVVATGLGLEERLDDAITQLERDGTTVVRVGDELAARGLIVADRDPHFWQDPVLMQTAATLIAEGLAAEDPSTAGGYRSRAAAYSEELGRLDAEVSARYGSIPAGQRLLVTTHDAFGYLARRYGFEVVGVVISGGSTLAAPSARELDDLVTIIDDLGVRAIFAENIGSSSLAETIAEEVGHEVVIGELYSDSLGEPSSGAETYLGMIRTNAERIVAALIVP